MSAADDDILATIAVDTARSDYYLEVAIPGASVVQQGLSKPVLSIGRSADCDVVLEHKTVSRRHLRLERSADRFRAINESSSNPIRVNGKDVEECWLRPGSRIAAGDVILTLRSVYEEDQSRGWLKTLTQGYKALCEGAPLISERSKLRRDLEELKPKLQRIDERVGRAVLELDGIDVPAQATAILATLNETRNLQLEAEHALGEHKANLARAEQTLEKQKQSGNAPLEEARRELASARERLEQLVRDESALRDTVEAAERTAGDAMPSLAVDRVHLESAGLERRSAEEALRGASRRVADLEQEAIEAIAPAERAVEEATARLMKAKSVIEQLGTEIGAGCRQLGESLRGVALGDPILSAVTAERDALFAEEQRCSARIKEIDSILGSGADIRKQAGAIVAIGLVSILLVAWGLARLSTAYVGPRVEVAYLTERVAMIVPLGVIDRNGTEQFLYGGHGTGFAWSEPGYLVTNYHVAVEGADNFARDLQSAVGRHGQVRLIAFFSRDEYYEAEVAWADDSKDIAVLRLVDDAWKSKRKSWPHLELAAPVQGGKVFACGFPGAAILSGTNEQHDAPADILEADAFTPTFTDGVVSKARVKGGGLVEGARLIQTNADINPGNSGGPLVDEENRVIGINTFISKVAQGINFSVLIQDVQAEIDVEIERDKKGR